MTKGKFHPHEAVTHTYGERIANTRNELLEQHRTQQHLADLRLVRSFFAQGPARREAILRYLSSSPGARIVVNRSWALQTSLDADLRRLLKQEKIKQIRIKTSRRCAHTYLVLAQPGAKQ